MMLAHILLLCGLNYPEFSRQYNLLEIYAYDMLFAAICRVELHYHILQLHQFLPNKYALFLECTYSLFVEIAYVVKSNVEVQKVSKARICFRPKTGISCEMFCSLPSVSPHSLNVDSCSMLQIQNIIFRSSMSIIYIDWLIYLYRISIFIYNSQ